MVSIVGDYPTGCDVSHLDITHWRGCPGMYEDLAFFSLCMVLCGMACEGDWNVTNPFKTTMVASVWTNTISMLAWTKPSFVMFREEMEWCVFVRM